MNVCEKIYSVLCVLLVCSCGDSSVHVDDKVEGPPNPPSLECDLSEFEPNNTFEEANFVGTLPMLGKNTLCGEFNNVSVEMMDREFIYFFLNPPPRAPEVFVTLIVETDATLFPSIRLWQTVYNKFGEPTGQYTLLGIFFGKNGLLFVPDFPVPYSFLDNNDLFVQLEAPSPIPFSSHNYTLEYFTH